MAKDDVPGTIRVVVQSLDQAMTAAAAALDANANLTLESVPGAAGNVGIGWFVELVAQVQAAYPALTVTSILDCGNEAGTATAALRRGVSCLRLSAPPVTMAKVTDIAQHYGATILPMPESPP